MANHRRGAAARAAAMLGAVCGVIGLLDGFTEHVWKLGATGWFSGGALLTLLAIFTLLEGALADQKKHS